MGLPLTSMLRLSCGLSEQTIQLGGRGLEVSVVCVSAACGVSVCTCLRTCLHGYVYAPLCRCAHVCVCLRVICKCFTYI